MIRTIELTSWEEIITHFQKNHHYLMVYRGQSDSVWGLETSYERSSMFHRHREDEQFLVTEFQRGAKLFLKSDELPISYIDWLSFMQHHGVPTRLLDFTKSYFISLFFAFRDISRNESGHVSIWQLDKMRLSHTIKEKMDEFERIGLCKPNFDNGYRQLSINDMIIANNLSIVFCIDTLDVNVRYFNQQALFLMPGISNKPFMEQLSDTLGNEYNGLTKIIIPISIRENVLNNLNMMNINSRILFPGFDGFVQDLVRDFELESPLFSKTYFKPVSGGFVSRI